MRSTCELYDTAEEAIGKNLTGSNKKTYNKEVLMRQKMVEMFWSNIVFFGLPVGAGVILSELAYSLLGWGVIATFYLAYSATINALTDRK